MLYKWLSIRSGCIEGYTKIRGKIFFSKVSSFPQRESQDEAEIISPEESLKQRPHPLKKKKQNQTKQTRIGKSAELPVSILKEHRAATSQLHTWGSQLACIESLTKGSEMEAISLRRLVTASEAQGMYEEHGIKVTSCSFFYENSIQK